VFRGDPHSVAPERYENWQGLKVMRMRDEDLDDSSTDDQGRDPIEREVLEDFNDVQDLVPQPEDNLLLRRLDEQTAETPMLSGGDLDAAWERAHVGEEGVGGSTPTPDQDVVDELGQAVGISYEDAEPLHTEDKLRERDRERWELDPRSRDDEETT